MQALFRQQSERGMTLVEALVVLGIYTVLMLVIMASVVSLYQTNSYTFAQANEVDNARRGMIAWMQDVREMNFSAEGAFPLAVRDPHRMGFYGDVDQDNSIEYIEFILATTTLYKYIYNPVGNPPTYPNTSPDQQFTLSEYVQNLSQGVPTFLYFDTNGLPLATSSLLTDVRYLRAQVVVNIDPVRAPGEFMLRTSVAPRNLKDNL